MLPSLPAIRAELTRRRAAAEHARIAQDAAEIRGRCKTLAGFIREAWHVLEPEHEYVHGWHIDLICAHLEAITRGEITRLLVNVPPGTMKSSIISVCWQAWEWGPCGLPHLRYLSTSHNDKYVARDTRKTRDLVASDWYQQLWGDKVRLTRAAETSFANEAQGFREGVPFSSLTGGRADRVLIDDPHSTETAESDTERATTTRIFRESVPTRVRDPKTSAIVVIMQRLHAQDVSGIAIDLKLGYVHVMLPMEFEPERRCVTQWGKDPRTYEGELLFPERFPREVVERDSRVMGSYAVAGQFQQRPAPRSGGMFKRHWFEIVPAAPAGAKRCRGWDFAGTEERENNKAAFTAGVLMSVHRGTYYVEAVFRERLSPAGVETAIKNTAKQDGRGTLIDYPQDPGQAGKMQARHYASKLAGYRVRYSPETGSKITRAEPYAAQAEAGNVKLIAGPWNDVYLDELCLFPGSDFKDQVDGSSRAFHRLTLGSGAVIMGRTVGGH